MSEDATATPPGSTPDRPGASTLAEGAGAAVLVSVQHELRTPLTVLGVTTDTLLGLVEDPAMRALLEAQQRALVKLEKLVDDVLDITQLVADGSRTDPQSPVEVATEVAQVALDITARDPSIRVEHAGCRGVRAVTVAPLFRLLVRCVLEDQVAFGKGAPVRVRAETQDGELRLWVRSDDPQWHLVEATTYSPHGGHGLNVLAASFLAERLGGGLEVPTVERQDLAIRLPQRRAADRTAAPAAGAAGA